MSEMELKTSGRASRMSERGLKMSETAPAFDGETKCGIDEPQQALALHREVGVQVSCELLPRQRGGQCLSSYTSVLGDIRLWVGVP